MLNTRGADVVYFHVSLSKLGYTIPKQELDEQVFGVGMRDALLQLQVRYHLSRTDVFDDATRVTLESAVAGEGSVQHNVERHICFDYGLPARSVNACLLSRGPGGANMQLGKAREAGIVKLIDQLITLARSAIEGFTRIA